MQSRGDTLISSTPGPAWVHEARRPTLHFLNGVEAGRLVELDPGTHVIGRGDEVDILIPSADVSREHAEIEVGEHAVTIRDRQSTNGTYVNGHRLRLIAHAMNDNDRIQLGHTIAQFSYRDGLESQLQESLYEAASKDSLTGAFNKRYMEDRLSQEWAFSIRRDAPLAIVIFDVDHFKMINDQYGHVAGDEVLRELARRTQLATRAEDVFARYGGEEFVVIMRQTTLMQAGIVAERISRRISHRPIDAGSALISVTISTGVAERRAGLHPDAGTLVKAADSMLYAAKAAGRNRVLLEGAA